MTNDIKINLFLVDDDAMFLKLLKIEFGDHTDFNIKTFPTGELCIESLAENPDVIILDYHLNGITENAMNGLETLDKIKKYNPTIPVVMLSSQDKIGVAVDCMKHNAFDYVVKGESGFYQLQKVVTSIFLYKKHKKEVETIYGDDGIPFSLTVVTC